MKLSNWIAEIGGRGVAATRLNVTKEAIHYWLAGKSTPEWKTLFKIIELSGSRVTMAEIFEETKVRERLVSSRKAARK